MSRRFSSQPTRDDHEETASPEFTRLLFLAMGIAMVIGLACGVLWMGYHLIRNWLN
jgi:hypothetical protein